MWFQNTFLRCGLGKISRKLQVVAFASPSSSFKAVGFFVAVIFLVEFALNWHEGSGAGEMQIEISKRGMQIPEFPQTLNRHNQAKLPRIINNRVQREIAIVQFPVIQRNH